MNVLQINNFEAIGGGSDRVYQLSTQLLLAHGHDVSTLACGTTSFDARKHSYLLARNGYIESNPIATLRNISNFVYRKESADLIDKIVAERRPDVAHLHIFYGQLSSSILPALKRHGIPCVMTVHEYRMLCPVSTLFTPETGICEKCAGGEVRHAVLKRCNRNSLPASLLSALEASARDARYNYIEHIDHFFMVSRFCLDKHVQYLPAIQAKSSVLYNFVNSGSAPHLVSVSAQAGRYLYCGRLSREKGVAMLCQAFAQRPELTLLLAGDGPLLPELRAAFGAMPNIRFLGKLDAEALANEIRKAWFTIAPSEWYENNPMAILESFAQGTPVLAAAIGGIPELVLPGVTGMLFQPSDATGLVDVLDQASKLSADQRQGLSSAAMKMIAERHSPAQHYAQLMEGYQAAIRQHTRPGLPA